MVYRHNPDKKELHTNITLHKADSKNFLSKIKKTPSKGSLSIPILVPSCARAS